MTHLQVLMIGILPITSLASPILLETETSAICLDVKDGKLFNNYFGAKVANEEDMRNSSEADLFYPSHWDASTGPHAVSILQPDGQLAFDPVYDSHRTTEPKDGQKLLQVDLKDRRYPVSMRLNVLAHRRSNIFERWVEISNHGDKPIIIQKAASASLRLKASRYFLTSFMGSWGVEASLREQEILPGNHLTLNSGSTPKGAAEGSPTFLISLDKLAEEESGEVILGSLAWSGKWDFSFENGQTRDLDINLGYDPTYSAYTLDAGKSFATPRMILTHSLRGVGEASRNFHRWAREEGGVRSNGTHRDILLNSWEGAYFSFDEKLLHGMMDGCKQMGVELFVLDDGWFGNKYPRNNDKAGLGDWEVNAAKLPSGIDGLVQAAAKRGLKFGIWVEPEMVNPKSELYEQNPDWVVGMKDHPRREGRNQLVLDLSRPKVQDHIYRLMDELLSKNPGISYVKWDCNYVIVDPGSGYLPADRQQNLQLDYINGYYAVMDRIVKKHPAVIFQACGSGGGRADFGAMKYHHEFWTSDNTDPYDRVFIQWGQSHVFPAIAMGSHVTESPNHYSKRETPLKFRFDVAMSGRLGLELQPQRLKTEELAWANQAVSEYKRIRSVVQFGDLYRLVSPYKNDLAALQYVHKENGKDHAVFFAYLKDHRLINGYGPVRLAGLDPAKRYKVVEFNLEKDKKPLLVESGRVLGGDYLMSRGLRIQWSWLALQTAAVEITEE
jgi:alpha-galactosidase